MGGDVGDDAVIDASMGTNLVNLARKLTILARKLTNMTRKLTVLARKLAILAIMSNNPGIGCFEVEVKMNRNWEWALWM